MPFGGDFATGRDIDDGGWERSTVWVDATVADDVVGGYICDWLGAVRRGLYRVRKRTYAIVVGNTDTSGVPGGDTVDVELLEDCVGGGGACEGSCDNGSGGLHDDQEMEMICLSDEDRDFIKVVLSSLYILIFPPLFLTNTL